MRCLAFLPLIVSAVLACTSSARSQEFAGWRHYRAIHFDTSRGGADVAEDVRNFPVPIALDGGNFDFGQGKADGADIRFSTEADAGPLPYSIELWDSAAKRALVWVKVPTVSGASTTQTIHMQWGNPAAGDKGDSSAVFDTKENWVGVWHLGDEPSTRDGGYRDATANAAHATGVAIKPESRADGRVGRGLSLNYRDVQWVKVDGEKRKLFDITNKLTFSIWARARGYNNRANGGYETMFAKGDNSWRLQKYGFRERFNPPAELIEICCERVEPRADLCDVATTEMLLDKWYHFVGVHEHPHLKVYVNGRLDKTATFDTAWKSDDHAVGIGNQSQFADRGRQWDGLLDEARVLSVPKDEHWIKLDYESQKEGQRFLTFGTAKQRP